MLWEADFNKVLMLSVISVIHSVSKAMTGLRFCWWFQLLLISSSDASEACNAI